MCIICSHLVLIFRTTITITSGTLKTDCNSFGYDSELECCNGAYSGQSSGSCLQSLPNPPTTAPTESGDLDVYYPDYGTAWSEGACINTRPLPSGRPNYSTLSECCAEAYRGQVSNACVKTLPDYESPVPTVSPTTDVLNGDDYGGDWYPDCKFQDDQSYVLLFDMFI